MDGQRDLQRVFASIALVFVLSAGAAAEEEEEYLPVRSHASRKVASETPTYKLRGRGFPPPGKQANYGVSLSLSQNFSVADPSLGPASMSRPGGMMGGGLLAPMPPPEPEPGGPPPREPQGPGPQQMRPMGQTSTILSVAGVYLPFRKAALSMGVESMIPWATKSEPERRNAGPQRPQPPQPPGGPTDPMTSVTGAVSYSALRSLRLSASLRFLLQSEPSRNNPSTGFQPPGPPGMNNDPTVATAGLDWNITRNLSFGLNGSWGFEKGPLDPSASLRLQVPAYESDEESFLVRTGIQAMAPASLESREQGKITTIAAMLSPTYRNGDFSLALVSLGSFSFYSEDQQTQVRPFAASPQMPGPPGPEIFSTMNNVSLGVQLSDELSAQSSGGVTFTQGVDDTITWSSQATLLALTYSPGELSIGASFSLVSSRSYEGEMSFPNQPNVGLSLRYVFGSPMALRMGVTNGGPR